MFTGIVNARPETKDWYESPVDMEKLPFDPLQYMEHLDQLPFDSTGEPNIGQ